jgi:hypothetical protein
MSDERSQRTSGFAKSDDVAGERTSASRVGPSNDQPFDTKLWAKNRMLAGFSANRRTR